MWFVAKKIEVSELWLKGPLCSLGTYKKELTHGTPALVTHLVFCSPTGSICLISRARTRRR